jgi:hypothetical protein
MDEERFIQFMKADKKSQSTIKRNVNAVKTFEEYLSKHTQGRKLEEATPQDLRDFASWGKHQFRRVSMYVAGIRAYYEFKANTRMFNAAREIVGSLYMESYKLKKFRGVKKEHLEKLAAKGIETAMQMLDVGKTGHGREKLAQEMGIPPEDILEIVKLSNLARIPGLKAIRARLYYDAGLDTLDKIAAWNPEEMRRMLAEFVERTGFDGIPPLPKEASSVVSLAKHLPRIVEF